MKGFLSRLFGAKPTTSNASPQSDPPTEAREQGLVDLFWRMQSDVASGYYCPEEIITNACDYVEDELSREEAEHEARGRLPQLIAAQVENARNWPHLTDCDRLDEAFAALEDAGIVSRQNFTCCGTCGAAEIGDQMAAAEKAGTIVRGYAFFHMQDTDSAVEGDGLYLNYGAVQSGEEAAISVASEVISQLEAHGLATQWSGSWDQRIYVDIDWKRRFPFNA